MFTKILFSVVVLLEINFITSDVKNVYRMYSKIVKKNPEILSGETKFCKIDVYYWASVCQQVLIKLRELKSHGHLYLDYQSFTSTAALSKCENPRVVKFSENLFKLNHLHGLKIGIKMALCPCRTVVVSKHIRKNTNDYKNFVAVIPNPNMPANILVFLRITKNYHLSHYYKNLKYFESNLDLYRQATPPTTTTYPLHFSQLYIDLITSSSDVHNNIVEKTDKYWFAKMCLMSLKRPKFRQVDIDLKNLCNEKPIGILQPVILSVDNIQRKLERTVYPCSSLQNFENPNNLNSMDIAQRAVLLSEEAYGLSPGPNDTSLLLVRYNYVSNDLVELKVTEYIENVSELLLSEIQIPKYYEGMCVPNETSG